jgi:hypothetical protein
LDSPIDVSVSLVDQDVPVDERLGGISVVGEERVRSPGHAFPDERKQTKNLSVDLLELAVEHYAEFIRHMRTLAAAK